MLERDPLEKIGDSSFVDNGPFRVQRACASIATKFGTERPFSSYVASVSTWKETVLLEICMRYEPEPMNRYFKRGRNTALVLHLATAFVCFSGSVFAQSSKWDDESWSNVFYAGFMTNNRADELVSSFDYADNNLIGYALAYDRPFSGSQWSVGFELQFSYHFGEQEYAEIGLPVTVRYRPKEPWFEAIEGFAFGLGMSHATDVPIVEVETRGGSRRNLIYWMLEAEFNTSSPDTRWFVRIHHRSDAWGTLKPEGGSNAVVLGLKRDF